MKDIIHLKNISSAVTLISAYQKKGKNLSPRDLSLMQDISILADKEKIIYVGNDLNIIRQYQKLITKIVDLSDYSVTPEIVDSHTHLVFGGNRSSEYVKRINGTSYEEISNSGGGINFTSEQTNLTDIDSLFRSSIKKIDKISSYGIGTIEIKSGYGLNIAKEYEISLLIDQLKKHFSPKIQIINTFMAAHAIPPNFNNSDEYMEQVCLPALGRVNSKINIDFVDIFHELNYFTEKNVRDLKSHCDKINIPMRIHADEFNDNNGAKISAELGIKSADHLLSISDLGIKALANSNTVATLLPGTGYFLGKSQAPARKILDGGCRVSIASDFNPGSCHIDNLLLIANLSAPNYKMNQAELWASITLNPAYSLNLQNQGCIDIGMKPRFSFFRTKNIDEVTYSWSSNFFERIKEVDQFFF